MTSRDHTSYHEDVAAYLLGALGNRERRAFESHAASCQECSRELERLRPAAEMLPLAVEQVEPPPGLKRSLMEVVEREAHEAGAKPVRAGPARAERRSAPFGERLRNLLSPVRPGMALAAVMLALFGAFGATQILDGGDSRTIVAKVDETRLAGAAAELSVEGDGEEGATLRVEGMPMPKAGRVYQAWIQRDGKIVPQPTFDVDAAGAGEVEVPADLSEAEAVLVTREPRGGARTPSEDPVLSVAL